MKQMKQTLEIIENFARFFRVNDYCGSGVKPAFFDKILVFFNPYWSFSNHIGFISPILVFFHPYWS
jgi:hypothetical protein